jgi:hypothetical protein
MPPAQPPNSNREEQNRSVNTVTLQQQVDPEGKMNVYPHTETPGHHRCMEWNRLEAGNEGMRLLYA